MDIRKVKKLIEMLEDSNLNEILLKYAKFKPNIREIGKYTKDGNAINIGIIAEVEIIIE